MHDYSSGANAAAFGAFFLIYAIVAIATLIFALLINWRIASKAGYPGAYSLLMLIPFVNFVIIIIFAFSEWPLQRQLRMAGIDPNHPSQRSYIPPGGGGYAPQATLPTQTYTAPPPDQL